MDLIISPSGSGCSDVKCNELIQQHGDTGAELFKHAQRNLENMQSREKITVARRCVILKIRFGYDVYVRNRGVTGRHNLPGQFELLRNGSSRQCFYISARQWSSEKF